MSNVALHAATKQRLETFIERPSHALGLVGSAGSGKTTLAYWLVAKLMNRPIGELPNYPYLKLVASDGASISIEAIRELNSFLKLKTLGKDGLRRFVIIEHADTMTIEAQNALLKSLEEPPIDTLIILTLENDKAVLPTVTSRLQLIQVYTPPKDELRSLFKATDAKKFEQTYNLSGGLPGLTQALLGSETDHPLTGAVDQAKKILTAQTTFERLQFVDDLAKQREAVKPFLQALKRISVTSLNQAARKQDTKSIKRWQQILTNTYNAENALLKGAQTKLILTNLMLNL